MRRNEATLAAGDAGREGREEAAPRPAIGVFGPGDILWERSTCHLALRLWEPERIEVVLGRCSRAEEEVRLAECLASGVPVSRRRGGGCAVVVGPGTLVLSCAWTRYRPPYPVEWMEQMSGAVTSALAKAGVSRLAVRRGGDVTLGDRKVMGACLYVGAGTAIYGASLLVNPDLSLVDRFLHHPPREPEYRRGRSHGEFLTSLRQEGYPFDAAGLGRYLGEALWSTWAAGADRERMAEGAGS